MIPVVITLFLLPAVRSEPAEVKTPTGTLAGVLDLPAGPGPWPAVLVLAGSGPTDRDGNQPALKTDNLKMLGRALAVHGIAALRVDKQGVGGSRAAGGKEADLRFEHLAADAAAWIGRLRADGRFITVGVVGHSEGALIGLLAAKRQKVDAFVSLCGAGRPAAVVLREQLQKNLPAEQYEASDKLIAELEAGREVRECPRGLEALFRPSVQPYLISWLRYDPAKEITGLRCPVLIVSGGTDIQIPPADAAALAAANKAATAVAIADMSHVLKEQKSAKPFDQLATYLNRDQPLHPKLVPAVVGFLKGAPR